MRVSREEWIGVPIPDPVIPREWVLSARNAIKVNEKVSNCGRRFWELTGSVLRCAACGGAMATNFITPRKTGYYRCGKRYRLGAHACSQGKNLRAEETETVVWGFVSQDQDVLLSYYSQIAVEHLDRLKPEERNRVYKMLDLRVLAHEDGNLEVKWALGGGLCRDNEPLPPGNCHTPGR